MKSVESFDIALRMFARDKKINDQQEESVAKTLPLSLSLSTNVKEGLLLLFCYSDGICSGRKRCCGSEGQRTLSSRRRGGIAPSPEVAESTERRCFELFGSQIFHEGSPVQITFSSLHRAYFQKHDAVVTQITDHPHRSNSSLNCRDP